MGKIQLSQKKKPSHTKWEHLKLLFFNKTFLSGFSLTRAYLEFFVNHLSLSINYFNIFKRIIKIKIMLYHNIKYLS